MTSVANEKQVCSRMKLMLVGQENVGKTSLGKCLLKSNVPERKILKRLLVGVGAATGTSPAQPALGATQVSNATLSTDGIDMTTWVPHVEDEAPVSFTVWDFAGQEVYYSTHQFFLSQRSIYIVVFDMSTLNLPSSTVAAAPATAPITSTYTAGAGTDGLERVNYWLQCIALWAPQSPVIIVGTHLDEVSSEKVAAIEAEIEKEYLSSASRFKNVQKFFAISTKTRKHVNKLCKAVVSAAHGSSFTRESYPRSFFQLEALVTGESANHSPPLVSMAEFDAMAESCGIQKGEMSSVLLLLSQLGAIVICSEADSSSDSMIILDPHWLTRLMATLITSKPNFVREGILHTRNLDLVWRAPDFPRYLHPILLSLLQKYELAFPLPDNKGFLLTPLLGDQPLGTDPITPQSNYHERIYKFDFVPLFLFSRLMIRIMYFMEGLTYWKTGLLAHRDNTQALVLFDTPGRSLVVKVWGKHKTKYLRFIMESVDILLSGWYKLKYTFWVPCLCVNCRPASVSSPVTRTRSSSLGSSSDPPPVSPSAALDLETPTSLSRPTKPLPALPKRAPTASVLVSTPVVPSSVTASITVTPPPAAAKQAPATPTTPTAAATPLSSTPPATTQRALPHPPTRSLSSDAPSGEPRTGRQQMFKKALTVFELAQQGSKEAPAALGSSQPASKANRPPTVVMSPVRAREAPASLSSPRSVRPFTAVLSPSTNGMHTRGSVAPTRGALSPFQSSPAAPVASSAPAAPPAPSAKTVTRSATHASLQVTPSASSSRPITPPPPVRRLTPPTTRPATPPTPTTPEKQAPALRQLPVPQPKSGGGPPPPPRPPPPPPPTKSRPKLPSSQAQSQRRASDTPESPRNRPRTGSLGEADVPALAINNEPVPIKRDPSPSHSVSSSALVKKRNLVSRFLSTSVVDTQANIAEAEKYDSDKEKEREREREKEKKKQDKREKDNKPPIPIAPVHDRGMFLYSACEKAIMDGLTQLPCSKGTGAFTLLAEMVPELAMTDLNELAINYSNLELLDCIGTGGFGSVHKARLKPNNQLVAVKKLSVSEGDDFDPTVNQDAFREFRREVWISSTLMRKTIVELKGYCLKPFCLVMEYLPNGSLYDFLRKNKDISWSLKLKIASNIADALHFLHSQTPKILHRDLKSPNVLMADTKRPTEVVCKVSDFGESRAIAISAQGRQNLANPLWLAPEIMKRSEYTEKSDIFSYGIILWELLTGQEPYSEYPISQGPFKTPLEEAIIKGLRPTIPPNTPTPYQTLVKDCWAASPQDRPAIGMVLERIRGMQRA